MHEAAPSCIPDHCFYHQVDEPGATYKLCPECFHGFRSAHEIRKIINADRRVLGLRWKFIRVSKVTFCPLCAHDW